MDGVHQLTDVIQVCTDGSALSEKGVETAVRLAKALGLPLVGMTSVMGKPNLIHGLEHEDAATRERLAFVQEAAKREDVPVQLVAEHCASPAEGILAVAHRYDARFVVMASSVPKRRRCWRRLTAPCSSFVKPSQASGRRAVRAAAASMPEMLKRLARLVSPETSRTAFLGIPRRSARKLQSLALAFPSTGGAFKLSLSLPLYSPTMLSRLAPG